MRVAGMLGPVPSGVKELNAAADGEFSLGSASAGLWSLSWLVFEPSFANCVQTTHTALKADLTSPHLSHYECAAQTFLVD